MMTPWHVPKLVTGNRLGSGNAGEETVAKKYDGLNPGSLGR
jgi:hypothetical protein